MTKTLEQPTATPSPVESPELVYRALSPKSIFTLLLGLASAVALISPLLGIVGIVTVILGLVALRQISLESDRYSGRLLAVAGISLALFFVSWSVVRDFSRRAILQREAQEFADDYLTIVGKKDAYRAHQLHLTHLRRLDPTVSLKEMYASNEEVKGQFETFSKGQPLAMFLDPKKQVSFQQEGVEGSVRYGLDEVVTFRYRYHLSTGESKPFWLVVRRSYSNLTGQADWNVQQMELHLP